MTECDAMEQALGLYICLSTIHESVCKKVGSFYKPEWILYTGISLNLEQWNKLKSYISDIDSELARI